MRFISYKEVAGYVKSLSYQAARAPTAHFTLSLAFADLTPCANFSPSRYLRATMKFTMLNVFRFTFAIAMLFALVSASAVRRNGPKPSPSPSKAKPGPSARPKTPKKASCKTGPVECCQSVVDVHSPTATKVLNALKIWVGQDDDYDVGLSCASVDTFKHGQSDCNASLVCCEDDTHKGIIDLKCTPAETD